MKIALRADTRPEAGLGHIKRMSALGNALIALGAEPLSCTDDTWPQADALVVDDYTVSPLQMTAHRLRYPVVVVIDDGEPGARNWPADIVVHPRVGAQAHALVTKRTTLAGKRYVMLGPEYTDIPRPQIQHPVKRALLTLGGIDPDGATAKLIPPILEAIPADAILGVVIGQHFSDELVEAIDGHILAYNGRVGCIAMQPSLLPYFDMVDLAITGGGITLYESAAAGCPTIGVELADNQHGNLAGMAAEGCVRAPGKPTDRGYDQSFSNTVRELCASPEVRQTLAENGWKTVDRQGAHRVAKAIVETVKGRGRQ